jgi:hypothetical protein
VEVVEVTLIFREVLVVLVVVVKVRQLDRRVMLQQGHQTPAVEVVVTEILEAVLVVVQASSFFVIQNQFLLVLAFMFLQIQDN